MSAGDFLSGQTPASMIGRDLGLNRAEVESALEAVADVQDDAEETTEVRLEGGDLVAEIIARLDPPNRPDVQPDTEVRYVVLGPGAFNGYYGKSARYAKFERREDAQEWLAKKGGLYSLWVERVDTWPLVPADEVAT